MEGSEEEIAKLLKQALDYAKSNDLERAKEIILPILERDPANAGALYLRVFGLRRTDQLDEAERVAEDAIKLWPRNVWLIIERGLIEDSRREHKKAIEFFDRALALEPQNTEALKSKITALRRLQRFDEARKQAGDALKITPDNTSLLIELGFVEYDQKEYAKAIEFFDRAITREATNVVALIWKIRSMRILRQFEAARGVSDDALKLVPEAPALLIERAYIEFDQQKYENAIEFFDKVLGHSPKNEEALQWKIRSMRFPRRFEVAQRAADDALRLVPDSAALLIERAYIEFDQQKYEKAIEFFDKALGHEPKNEEALKWRAVSRGWSALTQENLANAERLFFEAAAGIVG